MKKYILLFIALGLLGGCKKELSYNFAFNLNGTTYRGDNYSATYNLDTVAGLREFAADFYIGNTSRLNMRMTFHGGALFYVEPDYYGNDLRRISVSPNVVYMQQGEFKQLNTGMYVNFYPFVAGLWLRHNFSNPDAVIASLGFQQPQYKIGYSFDFTLSRMGLPAGGAHEISFVWLLPCPKKELVYKAIKCPSF